MGAKHHVVRGAGFTLIELSIVLVIIGLIVGGILVGRNLIKASEVRATITQIEKYNTATNTFREKYGGLPGDLAAPVASQFGFVARTGVRGMGDGNGVIEGYEGGPTYGWTPFGETVFFWEDLSSAHLIDQSFSTASETVGPNGILSPNLFVPQAALPGATIEVFSVCQSVGNTCFTGSAGINYFALMVLSPASEWGMFGEASGGITVAQAYMIDSKLDDGLPTTGNVQAFFPNHSFSDIPYWSTNAATPSAITCYDTTSKQYSITQNNGAGANCGLSFRFQ
jgi:prepilin-type N-terminal cleavage/methylation domain-containing protein